MCAFLRRWALLPLLAHTPRCLLSAVHHNLLHSCFILCQHVMMTSCTARRGCYTSPRGYWVGMRWSRHGWSGREGCHLHTYTKYWTWLAVMTVVCSLKWLSRTKGMIAIEASGFLFRGVWITNGFAVFVGLWEWICHIFFCEWFYELGVELVLFKWNVYASIMLQGVCNVCWADESEVYGARSAEWRLWVDLLFWVKEICYYFLNLIIIYCTCLENNDWPIQQAGIIYNSSIDKLSYSVGNSSLAFAADLTTLYIVTLRLITGHMFRRLT